MFFNVIMYSFMKFQHREILTHSKNKLLTSSSLDPHLELCIVPNADTHEAFLNTVTEYTKKLEKHLILYIL